MFKVYALFSPFFNKLYIGYTSNLDQRIKSHNEIGTKGYTLRFRPWNLIYTESHNSKKEALVREKQLKSAKGRKFIWNIIKNL